MIFGENEADKIYETFPWRIKFVIFLLTPIIVSGMVVVFLCSIVSSIVKK